MSLDPQLGEQARRFGLQLDYWDATGTQRFASADAVRAVLASLGAEQEISAPLIEPVYVAWDGHLNARWPDDARVRVILEDGSDPVWGQPLPFGYHTLQVETRGKADSALIISAPWRAYTPSYDRTWGVFLPLHALRSKSNFGIGDFGALEKLLRFTGELGGSYVGVLPLLATFLDEPFEPSPYSAVSRLFWSETFVDPADALALLPCAAAQLIAESPGYQAHIAELNQAELIDYREVYRTKRRVLEPLARCFFESRLPDQPEFKRFLTLYPRVHDYAAFRAGPAGDRDFYVFAQFLAHRQLERLSRAEGAARLYLDMPIGVNGAGYDAQRFPELFARGASAGAPPDPFFSEGQNWGFAPLNPYQLRQSRYAYLREALQTQLRYAGALRLDHVMALHRLFWVPDGAPAREGVYVSYPRDEWYALLCLESVRHKAIIIGEDLGTVPPEVRQAMAEHHIQRLYVVQFEFSSHSDEPLAPPPAESVASLNTHDMPPFASFCRAGDAGLRVELGLLDQQEAARVRQHRLELMARLETQLQRAGFLHHPAAPGELQDALLAYLAASRARIVLISLEDLWGEDQPQNVPGTSHERPNWRRTARYSLEQIIDSPEINATLRRLNELRNAD